MKKKDGAKNIIFGFLNIVVITLLGVLIPKLFLKSFGSEVNGLVSSVKQIFSYFSLLEAGIGGATVQALYAPIARNDHESVSSVLAATSRFYRRTGIIYALAVVAMAFIYPATVKTDVSRSVIIWIIIFTGGINVIRYMITAKLQLLIETDGKSHVLTNSNTIFSIASDLVRIILLYCGAGVIWVQAVYFFISILQSLVVVIYTRKHYSWLDSKAKPDYASVSQRNSVLLHQISTLIFNNTDTVVLTYFCGLKVVSVYSMYSMLFGMIANLISTISSGISFARGQAFQTDRKRFIELQEAYETYFLAAVFALFAVAYVFVLPFLKLYTSGINDISYIDRWLPLLFVVTELLNYGRSSSNNIISYAGHFRQTQWRAIIEAVINITVSVIGVYFLGIYGVLLGTIAALLYRANDIILYANHRIMHRSARPTYRRWLRNALLFVIVAFAGHFFPQAYSGYLPLIGCAGVVTVAVIALFFGVNTLFEKQARRVLWTFVKPMAERVKIRISGIGKKDS